MTRPPGMTTQAISASAAVKPTPRVLRGWGAAVDIVERAPEPPRSGTGIYLPGNAVRALAALGVWVDRRPEQELCFLARCGGAAVELLGLFAARRIRVLLVLVVPPAALASVASRCGLRAVVDG